MKILMYGANGWIGNQFFKYLISKSNAVVYKGNKRVDDFKAVSEEIQNIKPDSIISFVGRTHGKIGDKVYSTIDYLEQEGKLYENIRDNLYSPISLALLCKELNIHLTYLGTGCIFDYRNEKEYGREINGFKEEDKPNFFGSSYSVTKGFTDMLMHQLESNILNLRIRMPITADNNPRNFITKIVNYEKICSIPNSMTVLPDFFPIILDLIKNNNTGTINLTNPGLISHNEILDLYREIVDKNFTYKNFSIEEQNKILDSKRSNNFLDTTKLESLYPEIKNIKDSIIEILKKYK